MKVVLLILVLVAAANAHPSGESDDSSSHSSSSHEKHHRPNKPHIVYFLVDNWDEIGYQDPFFITPTMDELAADGIKLTHFYAAVMCTPSRARLMTGKHEVRYGLQTDLIRPDKPYGLPLYLKTLPDRLRELGYSTHQVGKWHLGHHRREYTPLHRGFDTFYGFYNGLNSYLSHSICCPINCSHEFGYDMRDMEEPVPVREMDNVYDSILITKAAERVIDRQDPNKPMFLLLSSHETHLYSRQVPQKYLDLYLPKVKDMDPAAGAFLALKGAKATVADDMVRNLVNSLKANGLWDNTIFILTTDNGQMPRGNPSYITHPLLFRTPSETLDGRQRGPAFFHSPLFPDEVNGNIIDDLTTIMDLFPTILNMAGDHVDESTIDGLDLWNLLINGAPSTREEYLQTIDPGEPPVGESMFPGSFDTRITAAMRVGDYKLITGCADYFPTTWDNGTYLHRTCEKFWHDHHRNYFLYNIRQDRYEKNDLADNPAQFDRIVHMVDRLKWWDDQSVPPLDSYPQAAQTYDACPSRMPDNAGRTYNFFGPYATGEDWQLSLPKKKKVPTATLR